MKLGKRQLAVLDSLGRYDNFGHNGYWSNDCGWTYGTQLQTLNTLESLRRRNLVAAMIDVPSGVLRWYLTAEDRYLRASLQGRKEIQS